MFKLTIKHLVSSVLCLGLTLFATAYQVPQFNSAGQNTFSSHDEAIIGRQFYGMIYAKAPLLQDPFVNDYVSQLGHALASHSPRPQDTFTFFVINESSINAFAGPGGYIGIHTGTLLAANTRGQLAAVLAHEIAHVTQRHIARGIEQAKKDQLLSLGSILASVLTGAGGVAGAGAAHSFERGMHTSRQFEQEADRVGIQTLQKAGFNASDMADFMQHMQGRKPSSELDELTERFSSHPLAARRLAEAGYHTEKTAPASRVDLSYTLIQARALASASQDPRGDAKRLQNKVSHTDNLPLQYTYALLLLRANQSKAAYALLNQLNKRLPENSLIEASLADSTIRSGQVQAGLARYQSIVHYEPDNYGLVMSYASALMSQQRYREAARLLQNLSETQTPSVALLHLLSQAQGQAGELKLAHLNRARYFARLGQYQQAITQLKQAEHIDAPRGLNHRIKRLMDGYLHDQALLQR